MTGDANAAKRNHIEQGALRFCKKQFGHQGLKIGEQIHEDISWRPNFYLRNGPVIFAVEVGESLDATIFKLVATDILNFSRPVALALACPLEAFQGDTKRAKVKELKKNGIGVLTIDEDGDAEVQVTSIPLAQHISEELLTERVRELPERLRILFRAAHQTFLVNPGQGLQAAGQIVEAVVDAMAGCAVKNGKLSATAVKGTAADRIDALYDALKPQRAALGGARSFLKTYRNVASHPAHSAKDAMKKINSCRDGFFQAIGLAKDLSGAMNALGYRLRLHLA